VKPWVQYSLVRLATFAIALVVLGFVATPQGVPLWVSAIVAAIIGWCVAYIFFGKLRDAVARDLAERRAAPAVSKDADAEAEDVEAG
jgi:small-conductance mechanosensitive channel